MSYIYHCVKSVRIWSFFWSVFSRIRTEYGEIRSISPYSVRMRENTDQKELRIWTLFTQCILKVLWSRFQNLPMCSFKNNALKMLHSDLQNFPVVFPWSLCFSEKVAYFLTNSIVIMFVKKHFVYQKCAYLKN